MALKPTVSPLGVAVLPRPNTNRLAADRMSMKVVMLSFQCCWTRTHRMRRYVSAYIVRKRCGRTRAGSAQSFKRGMAG